MKRGAVLFLIALILTPADMAWAQSFARGPGGGRDFSQITQRFDQNNNRPDRDRDRPDRGRDRPDRQERPNRPDRQDSRPDRPRRDDRDDRGGGRGNQGQGSGRGDFDTGWRDTGGGRPRGPGMRREQDQARDAVNRGSHVPLGGVLGNIRRRSPGGRLLDAGLENDGRGRAVYRVRWSTSDGRRVDYIVDAQTGQVIGEDD
jgi:hypothetical protein